MRLASPTESSPTATCFAPYAVSAACPATTTVIATQPSVAAALHGIAHRSLLRQVRTDRLCCAQLLTPTSILTATAPPSALSPTTLTAAFTSAPIAPISTASITTTITAP